MRKLSVRQATARAAAVLAFSLAASLAATGQGPGGPPGGGRPGGPPAGASAGQPAQQAPAGRPTAQQAQPAAPTGVIQSGKTPGGRRDPFRSLAIRAEDELVQLPPGKAGLLVSKMSIDGIVHSATDKLAVVTQPGRNRAYFLREGDEVYNARVAGITEDGVIFVEKAVDAFGKPYEREVVKRLK